MQNVCCIWELHSFDTSTPAGIIEQLCLVLLLTLLNKCIYNETQHNTTTKQNNTFHQHRTESRDAND